MFESAMQDRVLMKDGVYTITGSECDADCFNSDDVFIWKNHGFEKAWKAPTLQRNDAYVDILNRVLNENKPVIDIASGPSMGFIPAIKAIKPQISCLAVDASDILIQSWKRFFAEHIDMPKVELAQFSLLDIPFKDESIDVYTSYLGIGSTRHGEKGYDKVLSELFRTLKPGGKLFTVEGEWIDKSAYLELFSKMNREPWQCFIEEERTWNERFIEHGFEVLFSAVAEDHYFTNDNDFELSQIALENNIKIGMTYKTYILEKTANIF